MTRLIKRIPKRENEEIRVSVVSYRGLEVVDVRLFYKMKNEYFPTMKGLIISRKLVKELIEALQKA